MNKCYLFVSFLLLSFFAFGQEWIRYIPEPDNNYFVLVIDRSGSMEGQPLDDAKQAAIEFVRQLQPEDYCALITFESKVHFDQDFTNNKDELIRKIQSMETRGRTALYDGVAKAIQILRNKEGSRVILFLTDGDDNSSSFSVSDIRKMNIGEGTQAYGIGLGNIDHESFKSITDATRGEYRVAGQSSELAELYQELLDYHYNLDLSGTGSLSLTSLPHGVDVRINGESAGRTPLVLARQLPGTVDLDLLFQKKTWSETVEIREGYRGIIRAREDQLMPDLIIETSPFNSAVFVDDSYVGLSAMFPSQGSDHSNQLIIENITPGPHRIRIVAVPDVDLSTAQVFEFDFNMDNMTAYMNVAVFMKRASIIYNNGKREQVMGNRMDDIQGSLDRFNSTFGR